MKDKKKRKIEASVKEWQEDKPLLIAEQDLIQEKKDVKNRNKIAKQGLTTTKRLMLFLFISCTIIQIFTLVVTAYSIIQGIYDFTALQMLITAVVGEVVAFAVYSIKSLKENTKGGIVYESAKWQNMIKEEFLQERQEIEG